MVDVTSANQTWLDCFLHFFLGFALFATRAFQSHLGCETTMCDSTLDILGMMVPSGCFVSQLVCDGGYVSIAIEIPAFPGGMKIHKSQLYIDVLTQQGYKVLTQPQKIYV